MSTVGDALRPFWLPGINGISGELSTSLKAWLSEGDYVFHGLNANQDLVFLPIDFKEFLKCIAYDINRMSSAAVETVCGIQNPNDLTRSTAWGLIRNYYSAFYACHAICRIFSSSISKIDKPQSKVLNRVIRNSGWQGQAVSISDDLYRIVIDSKSRTFVMTKLGNLGHHEGAWKEFSAILQSLSISILANTALGTVSDRQDASMFLSNLRDILQSEQCTQNSNWLSQVRNGLNYRHEYGAWYPHEKSKNFRDKFHSNSASWKKDPSKVALYAEELPILKFSKGCTLTLSLLYTILVDMEKRNNEDKSFLKYGVCRLIK